MYKNVKTTVYSNFIRTNTILIILLSKLPVVSLLHITEIQLTPEPLAEGPRLPKLPGLAPSPVIDTHQIHFNYDLLYHEVHYLITPVLCEF